MVHLVSCLLSKDTVVAVRSGLFAVRLTRKTIFQEPKMQEAVSGMAYISTKEASVLAADPTAISFFEKYLTVWVFLCILCGSLIGFYKPESAEQLAKAEFAGINAVVAVLLWVMIFPMLVQIVSALVCVLLCQCCMR